MSVSESSTPIQSETPIEKKPRNRYFPDNTNKATDQDLSDAKTLKVINPKTGETELEIKNPAIGAKRISKEGCKLCLGRGFHRSFTTNMGRAGLNNNGEIYCQCTVKTLNKMIDTINRDQHINISHKDFEVFKVTDSDGTNAHLVAKIKEIKEEVKNEQNIKI